MTACGPAHWGRVPLGVLSGFGRPSDGFAPSLLRFIAPIADPIKQTLTTDAVQVRHLLDVRFGGLYPETCQSANGPFSDIAYRARFSVR